MIAERFFYKLQAKREGLGKSDRERQQENITFSGPIKELFVEEETL